MHTHKHGRHTLTLTLTAPLACLHRPWDWLAKRAQRKSRDPVQPSSHRACNGDYSFARD